MTMTDAINDDRPVVGTLDEPGQGGVRTDRPLRIAYCISRTFERFQGTYGRYCGQARLLRDLGHDVTVFGVNREMKLPADEMHFGIPVHRVPVKSDSWGGPKNFLNFRKMHKAILSCLREGKFDAVKIIGQDLCPMIPMVQRSLRIPVIFDAHEPQIYGFWTGPRRALLPIIYGLEKRYSRMADAVQITSNWQKNKYETWGCTDVTIVGNQPLWDERIEEWPAGKFDEAKSGGPVIFGRLGTVYKGTGLDELLQAFARVFEKYPDRARLRMAGKVAEYYEEEFARTIAPYKDGLILTGAYNTTDMPQLYGEMHISVLPYLMDANFSHINPSKFYDSIGNACVVVMTPIGDMGEILGRVHCGKTIDPGNIDTIVEAMSHYLEHPDAIERDARTGFDASLGEFHWKANQRQLEETFQKIVG
ncbi:MAG: glycosyltransferase [Planctomycetes bacterium]|nr:glycosyltransferase [Planctomycetota bacterium]NOG54642.1 glycosyltransferase family 4 protein [Planctomycetota bacterium]